MFWRYLLERKRNIMEKEKVMFTVSQIKIKTAEHVLSLAGIESYTLDQRDSAHAGLFGDIQLFVAHDDAIEARKILEEEEVL